MVVARDQSDRVVVVVSDHVFGVESVLMRSAYFQNVASERLSTFSTTTRSAEAVPGGFVGAESPMSPLSSHPDRCWTAHCPQTTYHGDAAARCASR